LSIINLNSFARHYSSWTRFKIVNALQDRGRAFSEKYTISVPDRMVRCRLTLSKTRKPETKIVLGWGPARQKPLKSF
jgi:hypothetical protein